MITLLSRRDLVTFRLDRQICALPIEPVVQIIEMVTIEPIPQIDHVAEGIINVHGALVPVVNLRRHLGLSPTRLQLDTPIILVQMDDLKAPPHKQADRQMVGLLVDEVLGVLDLPAGGIISLADLLPEGLGSTPILQGLAQTQNSLVLVLNPGYLFSADQANALAQAIAALSARLKDKGTSGPDMPCELGEGEFRP